VSYGDDHTHSNYASTDHFHYSFDIHGGAEEHHRHYDLEGRGTDQGREVDSLRGRVSNLEEVLDELRQTVSALARATAGHDLIAKHEADLDPNDRSWLYSNE
jgi:hypothetical protein